MIILGLAGQAGTGKDTVALYLQERYGFIPFSFSDALYKEVATAFGLESEDLLRNRATKEVRNYDLRLDQCSDKKFVDLAINLAMTALDEPPDLGPLILKRALSPRQILQWWGTEYRRAQDPGYWVRAARRWVTNLRAAYPYEELRPQYFVNTSVRFENEREMISYTAYHETDDATSWEGNIWHVHRDTAQPVHAHESETPLPVLDGEREIWNNADLQHLYAGVDVLLSSNVKFVRCEPMETPEQETT